MDRKKGFTLVEVLIVITIIAVTISIVFPAYFKLQEKFENYIKQAEKKNELKKKKFLSFIKDEEE